MLNEYKIELRKTFASKHIPDAVISSYNKRIDDSNDHEIIDILVTDNDIINDAILKTIIEKFLETLNKKEYTIMTMYLQGYTQKEISKVIGTSQCNISRIIKKLLIKLGA